MESLSFDRMAGLYDETRVLDHSCLSAALNWLVERYPPEKFGNVFYPGVGTGRIAIPLAEKGYRITAVDISEKMLSLFEGKLGQLKQPLQISLQKADVIELPFGDNIFDMGIAVHLFYFVRNWQKAVNEILRVLKHNGALLLMHTGTGAEVPSLNDRYREICAMQGYSAQDIGVTSNREVAEHLKKHGYNTEWIRDRWQWTSRLRLDKVLDYMRSRAYSFTVSVPDNVHAAALNRLESEIMQEFGSLEAEVKVPNQIYFIVVLIR